ncbi:MAG: Hsp20/alpha crystallin family protein [Candidatus Manganitrophaceae bacterium]
MAFGQLLPRRRSRVPGALNSRREMENIFENFFRDFRDLTGWDRSPFGGVALPSIDMYEEKDRYVVKAEVPGFDKDNIHISVADHTLQLRGEVKQEEEKEERNYYYNERYYGSFSREIPLPSAVNQEQIRATFKNGILTVELPKSSEAMPKEIKIETK